MRSKDVATSTTLNLSREICETMTAIVIDGVSEAAVLRATVGIEVRRQQATKGVTPCLAVVQVGSNPASQVYVKSKTRQAREIGIIPVDHHLPE